MHKIQNLDWKLKKTKKKELQLRGFEPGTYDSWVQCTSRCSELSFFEYYDIRIAATPKVTIKNQKLLYHDVSHIKQ